MLYTATANAKSEVYKELVDRLKTRGDIEDICREIREFCENCRPSSPIVCIEFCQIWRLKRELRGTFEALAEKPISTDFLNLVKNDRLLKILEALIEKPCSLKELRGELKERGHYHSLNLLHDRYVEPLAEAELIREENGLYRITSNGKNMYNVLTKNEVAKLPIRSRGYEEEVLKALLSGPTSRDELAKTVPRGALYRSLKRLQHRDLIVKSNLSGRIFYYKAKRRPTRRLSPAEMSIFKALPKEGISVPDLSEKVGIHVRAVYKYLRRLRYKRHVKKVEKTALYELTDAGRFLAQSLNTVYSLIQS